MERIIDGVTDVYDDARPNLGWIELFLMHREEGIMLQTRDSGIDFDDVFKVWCSWCVCVWPFESREMDL